MSHQAGSFELRDGPCCRYSLYLPPGYSADRRWPLVLYLHSSGERGDDQRQTHAGLGLALRRHPERFGCLVLLPQCPEDVTWVERPALLERPLAHALSTLPVDKDRLTLTGISMGGYGCWGWGAANAHRLAALMPVCGGGQPEDYPALCSLPIWAFHGSNDDAVPVAESRRMWDMVREAGGQIRYTEYTDLGHECWDRVYSDPAAITWLLNQRRCR